MKRILYQISELYNMSLPPSQTSHPLSHFPWTSIRLWLNGFFIKMSNFHNKKTAFLKTRTCYVKKWNFALIKRTKVMRICLCKAFDIQLFEKVNLFRLFKFLEFWPTRIFLVKLISLLKKLSKLSYFNKSILSNFRKSMQKTWKYFLNPK